MNWILQYWKAAAIITLFAGYSGYVYYVGGMVEAAKWEKKENELLLANQVVLDAIHAANNLKSAEYEQFLADLKQKNRALNGRLHAELQKNIAYSQCIVPTDGLHILTEAATSGRISPP